MRGLRRSRLTVRVQLSSAHYVFLLCHRSRLTVRVQLSSAHHVFLLCADFVSLGFTVRVQLSSAHHVFLLCADFVGHKFVDLFDFHSVDHIECHYAILLHRIQRSRSIILLNWDRWTMDKCMCVCVYEWCVYMYVVSVCQVCMFAPT